jgi:hypothetical protein
MRIQAMSRKETEKQPRDTALARFDGGSEVASRNIVIAREMARLEPMPEQADKAAFVAPPPLTASDEAQCGFYQGHCEYCPVRGRCNSASGRL